MSSILLHPVAPLALGAVLVPFVPLGVRRLLSLVAPLAALALLLALPLGTEAAITSAGHRWVYLRLDELSRVFALAFSLYTVIAGVYAWTDRERGGRAASLGLAGAGLGVVLAGDLLTLFFFWEWLTVTSLFIIWYGQTAAAWAAGFRYLIFHLGGAVVMLTGILLHLGDGGGGDFVRFEPGPAAWLILVGMATNAAVPPLHAWLSDAYPRASIYGTVFLAAFTTKAAVYALARGFPGFAPLVWAGVAMALFAIVYAVLENDIRRLLCYHIISQVGYMVAGVGLGSALAMNGASAHAFAHIFYKGLLMMAAGAVIHATGRGKFTELGALAKPMKWTLVLMMIGALSTSGFPFLNGFATKSMIISAAADADRGAVELLLLVASMGTFLYTGLKLPYFTFFGRDHGARVQRPVPSSMYLGMGLAAAVCIVTGVAPGATFYPLLPFDATYDPFGSHHFVESLQLLAGTALAFWVLRVKLYSEPATTLDIDALYRQPVIWLVEAGGAALEGVGARVRGLTTGGVSAGWAGMQRLRDRGLDAPVAVQSTVVFVGAALGAYVAFLLYR